MNPLARYFILIYAMLTVFCLYNCSKAKGPDPAAIVGKWQYTNSVLDTAFGGQWRTPVTTYDSSFSADVGQFLEFRKGDTIYYSYRGVTTWSNYAVKGHDLILIGSATSDTLTIHLLNPSQLQIGQDDGSTSWWANFIKIQ